jgi:hypothetical protein
MKKRAPMRGTQARQRMWQAMRVARQFSAADIVATAEVTPNHARKYLRMLAAHGYIACIRERQSGVAGAGTLWRLARDTGPYAPRVGKQLRDPNIEPTEREAMVTIPRSEYARALACARACQGMGNPEREVAALKEAAS